MCFALGLLIGLTMQPCLAKDASDASEWDTRENLAAARGYYRAHAQVILKPEQRLPNGIAWRLHVDGPTGTKGVRITWMPDANRRRTANRLLEGVQGEDLRAAMGMFYDREGAYESEGEYLQRLFANKGKIEPKGSTPQEINFAMATLRAIQGDVSLTYASSKLVSIVSVIASNLSRPDFYPRGLTFDLAQGVVYGVAPCTDRVGRFFRFGPLLRICDEASYRAFNRLYAEQAAIASRVLLAQLESAPKTVPCFSYFIDADKQPDADYQFAFNLTPNGLAAHRSFVGPGEPSECRFATALNPTIIPYHKLAPLMEVGPWRDELLALP